MRDQSETSFKLAAVNDYCKLELTWILTQLCLADSQSVATMLKPTQDGRQPILEHIVCQLQNGNWVQLDQVLWLVGNITAECGIYSDSIRQLDLCKYMSKICEAEFLPTKVISNIGWILINLANAKMIDSEDVPAFLNIARCCINTDD
jgi:hypothetical protein